MQILLDTYFPDKRENCFKTLQLAMDSSLYRTIISGDIGGLKQLIGSDHGDDLLLQMTPLINNTTLHVAVKSRKLFCVEEIWNRCPPWLLLQQNLEGSTPLHIAVSLGSYDIVLFLIHCAQFHEDIERGGGGGGAEGSSPTVLQQLVRMTNKENDTALHDAVRYHLYGVVELLTEADPSFVYLANNACETPLYLAVEDELYDFVVQILKTCPTSAHSGPCGRTALHAAIMRDNSDIVKLLLKKKPGIIIEADETGCTALHFAAYLGNVEMVVELLEADPSVGYMSNKDGKTALHVAVDSIHMHRSVEVIEAVSRRCPESWELVDNNGQNFLHVAVEKEHLKVILYVMLRSEIADDLINKKDINGNTPLHLAVMSKNDEYSRFFSYDFRVKRRAFNKDNLRALDIALKNMYERHRTKHSTYEKFMGMARNDRPKALNLLFTDGPTTNIRRISLLIKEVDKNGSEDTLGRDNTFGAEDSTLVVRKIGDSTDDKKESEEMEKVSQTHLLVATLIATVTFAAGFTLPGGYNSSDNGNDHKGMATLIKSSAFIGFMVSNSAAMLFSTFAVFVHFWSKLISDDKVKMRRLIGIALWCTFSAILAMVVAFVTGTYAVLRVNLRLAIPLGAVSCSFFLFCLLLIFKVHKWATPPQLAATN